MTACCWRLLPTYFVLWMRSRRTWPTLLSLIASSSQPMFVAWGPDLRLLYNEAYLPILGERHPRAFCKPYAKVWAELPSVRPILQRFLAGESFNTEDFLVPVVRDGRPLDAHFAFSFTPITEPCGTVDGIFCVCTETTDAVTSCQARERENRRLQELFSKAPGFICVLRGSEHRFEFAGVGYPLSHAKRIHQNTAGIWCRPSFPRVPCGHASVPGMRSGCGDPRADGSG
jgi:hypothetical protein